MYTKFIFATRYNIFPIYIFVFDPFTRIINWNYSLVNGLYMDHSLCDVSCLFFLFLIYIYIYILYLMKTRVAYSFHWLNGPFVYIRIFLKFFLMTLKHRDSLFLTILVIFIFLFLVILSSIYSHSNTFSFQHIQNVNSAIINYYVISNFFYHHKILF